MLCDTDILLGFHLCVCRRNKQDKPPTKLQEKLEKAKTLLWEFPDCFGTLVRIFIQKWTSSTSQVLATEEPVTNFSTNSSICGVVFIQ